MAQILQLPASDPILHRSPETEATLRCAMLVAGALDVCLDKVCSTRPCRQYLQRLLMGESQEAAYAATFGMPYEQLDEYFRKLRQQRQAQAILRALCPILPH